MRTRAFLVICITALATACAPSLKPDETGTGAGGPTGDGKIQTSDNGDGTYTTLVDATDEENTVYFDFESQEEVEVEKPLNSTKWDLGFRRYLIPSNGGISGPGGVVVAVLDGVDFDAVDKAPIGGFLTDLEDPAEDGDDDPDYVFNAVPTAWYAYDDVNHRLSPAPRTYVVRTVEGNHFKVRITDYYDDAGSPAYIEFKWGEIGPPSTDDSFSVDASSADAWVYVSIAAGGPVQVSDPSSDPWDIALQRTIIQTNSGSSGSGLAGARYVDPLDPQAAVYETVTSSPTVGHMIDSLIPAPGPPGQPDISAHPLLANWYDYDGTSHTVSTRGEVFLIRTSTGDYGKLQIIYWQEGVFEMRLAPVTRVVTAEQSSIDASTPGQWTYFSLQLGEPVEVTDPLTETNWDIALNEQRIQTNSGTSGMGGAGALDPMQATLGAITSAPTSGYSVDEQLSINNDDFSGNPVLNPWYNTDPSMPLDQAFLLQTADGAGYVKLKIGSYASGNYTIDWAYTGAGQTDF